MTKKPEQSMPHAKQPSAAAAAAGVRRIDARELFGGQRELVIVHSGREYQLRITSNGKLILTA